MQSFTARAAQGGWAAQLGRIADALEELVSRRRSAPADAIQPQALAVAADEDLAAGAVVGRQVRGIGGALALIAARRDADSDLA